MEVARLLVDHRADCTVQMDGGMSALTLACKAGHKQLVRLVLDARSDVDVRTEKGMTPLLYASREGRTQVCLLLLQHRASHQVMSSLDVISQHVTLLVSVSDSCAATILDVDVDVTVSDISRGGPVPV